MARGRWIWIAVTLVMAIVLLVAVLVMVNANDREPEPDLEIMSWNNKRNAQSDEVFTVTVTNNGGTLGSATIRCTVQTVTQQEYYETLVISLSPGEIETYTLVVDIAPDDNGQSLMVDCTLIQF